MTDIVAAISTDKAVSSVVSRTGVEVSLRTLIVHSKNMLCIPVMKDDKVTAVIQLINKVNDDGEFEAKGFTKPDERLVTMLAHHVAVLFEQSEA